MIAEFQLLPCPFCRCALVKLTDHRLQWSVHCQNIDCNASILGERAPEPEEENISEDYFDKYEQSAIDRWNRRD